MRTLRSADEVRPAEFADAAGDADSDMVAVAKTIIERRAAEFDPEDFHDRYQDALRELVESKANGKGGTKKIAAAPPPKVIDLMEALKRSLAEGGGTGAARPARRAKAAPDRRQATMLLPVEGGKAKATGGKSKSAPSRERKKAS
jgi:DNA end-binding protein Ku